MVGEDFNSSLIHCAISKISSVVWDGSDDRIGDIHLVRRGPSYAQGGELELFCVSSDPNPATITTLVRATPAGNIGTVVLIGDHNASAIRELGVAGFEECWRTIVYFKDLSPPIPRTDRQRPPPSLRFRDVTAETLALANSFYTEFRISSRSINDPSFISRLLIIGDACVGKIQLILCPPHGAFCVFGAIKETERKHGYFTIMMNAAETWARERSLPQMALFSSEFANTIKLYPKLGYSEGGTYNIFERTGR